MIHACYTWTCEQIFESKPGVKIYLKSGNEAIREHYYVPVKIKGCISRDWILKKIKERENNVYITDRFFLNNLIAYHVLRILLFDSFSFFQCKKSIFIFNDCKLDIVQTVNI